MALHRLLLALVALVAVVGCTAAPPADPMAVGPLALDVTYADDAAGLPMAVAFDPNLITTGLETADVVEIGVGQHVLDTAWFDLQGRMTLEFPAASDLPAGLLFPAADAVRLLDLPAGCAVTVDGAATASGLSLIHI